MHLLAKAVGGCVVRPVAIARGNGFLFVNNLVDSAIVLLGNFRISVTSSEGFIALGESDWKAWSSR
jgi:hypothetical protein